MTRTSSDQLDDHGHVWNGFDYALQTWIADGRLTGVGNERESEGSLICTFPRAEGARGRGGARPPGEVRNRPGA